MASHEKCSVCNEILNRSSILYCECCGRSICEYCLEEDPSWDYTFPKEKCPFCNGVVVDDSEFLKYLLEHHISTSKDELVAEFKVYKIMSSTVE